MVRSVDSFLAIVNLINTHKDFHYLLSVLCSLDKAPAVPPSMAARDIQDHLKFPPLGVGCTLRGRHASYVVLQTR